MVTGNDTVFCLKDHTLTLDEQRRAHLSLQLDPDTFQWAVIDSDKDLILEVGSLRFGHVHDLKKFVSEWPYCQGSFNGVTLTHRGVPYTLVPSGLFQPDNAQRLLSLSHCIDEDAQVRHTSVDVIKAVLLYTPLTDEEELVLRYFPSARVYANTHLLIDAVMRRNRFDRSPQVYADLSESFVEVCVAGHKELLLVNRYDIEGDADALYALSNVFSTLGLPQEETTLYLSGGIEIAGERFKLFRKYYPKLQIHFGFEMPKVTMALGALRKQAFMSLLNQYRCVS